MLRLAWIAAVALATCLTRTAAQSEVLARRADNSSVIPEISPTCKTSFMSLLSSPVAGCLNIKGLVDIINKGPKEAIAQPIEAWITDLCGSPACTQKDLRDSVGILSVRCTAELTARNLTVPDFAKIVNQYYSPVKKLLCLKGSAEPHSATTADGVKAGQANTKKAWCAPGMIKAVEAAFGVTLSLDSIKTIVAKVHEQKLTEGARTKLKTLFTCTQCGQAAFTIHKESAFVPDGAKRTEMTRKMSEAVKSCPTNAQALQASFAKKTESIGTDDLLKVQRRDDTPADAAASPPANATTDIADKVKQAAVVGVDAHKQGSAASSRNPAWLSVVGCVSAAFLFQVLFM